MSIYRGIDGERLYTAAEMKAARVEMVEKCYKAVTGVSFTTRMGNRAVVDCLGAISKLLKEEIENE